MKYLLGEDKYAFTMRSMFYDRNKIWFAESGCNEIYYYDITNKKVEMFVKLYDENEYQLRLAGDLCFFEDKMYVIPYSAQKLYKIDFKCKKVNIGIKIPPNYGNSVESVKFDSAHRYKDYVYLVSATCPAIVEYNCLTNELRYYDDCVKEGLSFFKDDDKETIVFRKTILVGNKIYAPSCVSNMVLEFNVETKEFVWHEVGSYKCSYSSAIMHGEWLWLSPRGKGPIVKWNIHTKDWQELSEFPNGYVPCDGSFGEIIYFNNYYYCIPLCSKVIVRVEEQTGRMELCMQEYGDWNFSCACTNNEQLYIYSNTTFQFLALNRDGKIECIDLTMPEKQSIYHKIHLSETYKVLKGEKPLDSVEMIFKEIYIDELEYYIDFVNKASNFNKVNGLTETNGYKIKQRLVAE